MTDKIQIAVGEVIEVQLTSETVVVENARTGRTARSTGRISNRMRLFLRETDGRERNYDFEGAKIGVHDGHRCAVVRGKTKRDLEPLNLMIANFSTDERDVFEPNVATFLYKRPFFGPIWKAFGLSLLMIAFGVFYSQIILGHHRTMTLYASFWWALFFAFLAFPVFWWIAKVWDDITERGRYRRARAALIADIEGRLRAHVKPAQAA